MSDYPYPSGIYYVHTSGIFPSPDGYIWEPVVTTAWRPIAEGDLYEQHYYPNNGLGLETREAEEKRKNDE